MATAEQRGNVGPFWVPRSRVHEVGLNLGHAKTSSHFWKKKQMPGKDWVRLGGVVWRRCRWWGRRLVLELTLLALFSLHVVMVWLFFPLGTEQWRVGMSLRVYGLGWSKKERQGHRQPITPVEQWIARWLGAADPQPTPPAAPELTRAYQSLELMLFSLFTPSFSFYLFKKLHILFFPQKQLYLFKKIKGIPVFSMKGLLDYHPWEPASVPSVLGSLFPAQHQIPRQSEVQLCWKIEPNCFWHLLWSFRFSSSTVLVFKY